jgi:putative MATE family efflux protein
MNQVATQLEADTLDVLPEQPPALRQLPGKLGRMPLWQQVAALSIWPFLEQLLNFMIGFVDTWLAGHMPDVAMSATESMAIAAYVSWGMSLIQIAVGVGAMAIIARAIGGRHKRVANAALGQALLMSLALGFFIAGGMSIAAPHISAVMGAQNNVIDGVSQPTLDFATSYLWIVCGAAPLSGVLFVGTACLRAAGDTRTPFIILLVVNVVNAVASAAFVYAPAPIGGHQVAGLAWGTALAWAVGAVLTVIVLVGGWGGIRLRWVRLRPHKHTMVRIARVAAPNFFESASFWMGNFIVVTFVGRIGKEVEPGALGAHVIAIRLEAISYLPGVALGMAAATLTGQYLGLGDVARARRAAGYCWVIGATIMGAMGVLFWLAPEALVRMVTKEPRLLAMTPDLLRICAPVQVLFATSIVLSQAMRGAGATRSTMLVSSFSTWCVRLPAAYLLGVHLGWGLNGLWIALCGELALRGVLFGGQFLRGRWAKVSV